MQIIIPDSWLRDHLETGASAEKIAEALTLCGPTVEDLRKEKEDWVYLIEVTSNRPDLLSVAGIAREAAAILPRFGQKAKLKESLSAGRESIKEAKEVSLELKIAAGDLGSRFAAIVLDNVSIKSSPPSMKKRLEWTGVRALNNVVDISNYLMLELGQPVHTFDFDKIGQAKMVMRLSQKGEKVVTLDGEERTLPEGTIIIEDGKGEIIDLCGIMGGKNSEIDEKTHRLVLFVQTYNPVRIRRTSQALAFRTEASARFEKGLDPELVMPTLAKGVKLLEELAGARVVSKLIDIYPEPYQAEKIKLDVGFAQNLIGEKIKASEMAEILTSLGFSLGSSRRGLGELEVAAPSWRAGDVAIAEDLVEEIARIYGYHNLPSQLFAGEIPEEEPNLSFFWEEKVKQMLSAWGFSEIVSFSMISQELAQASLFDPESFLELENPLTEELALMRRSLIPSLLAVVAQNQDKAESLALFELGNIYLPQGGQNLPQENPVLALAATNQSYRQLKGVVEALLDNLRIKASFARPQEKTPRWHPNRTALVNIAFDGHTHLLGVIGEITPQILANLGIDQRVLMAVLDFSEILEHASPISTYQPLPKYPAISQDLAFYVSPRTEVGPMIEEIKAIDKLIKKVELFDIHQDVRTFRLRYQDPEKTLTDEKVGKIRKEIIKRIEQKFGARLKGA